MVAFAFLASILFEVISQNFFSEQSDDVENVSDGHRRDTNEGFKRYYDENELDVGLGKVKEPTELLKDGDTVDIAGYNSAPSINILYCIG